TYTRSETSGLSKLHAALVADLVKRPDEFAKRAIKSELHLLVAFLTYVRTVESGFPAIDSSFAQKVTGSINVEDWNHQRATERSQQPNFIGNLATLFAELGKPEL